MRAHAGSASRGISAEEYFERKSRELIVPEEEIEAWELDTQDLDTFGARIDGD